MLKTIRSDQVMIGMYIQRFDGTWLSHPFWRAKFLVTSQGELEKIRDSGTAVVIDTDLGLDIEHDVALPPPRAVALRPLNRLARQAERPGVIGFRQQERRIVTSPAQFGKADKTRATLLYNRSASVVASILQECKLGNAITASAVLGVVNEIAAELERNSSALISVTRMQTKDDDTYTHLVATCALMVNLSREAGLDAKSLQDLGMGGLLHDIGKLQIDDEILRKNGELDESEKAVLARHPELGHAMLLAGDGVPPIALDICLHHHERLDGSGYPFGLSGDSLSRAVRMAAICDVYDAITSDRPYQKARPPAVAFAIMSEIEGKFDADLLFLLMRSLGVFPSGLLIRLRSNRLAMVLPSKGHDRLPIARAFYATVGSYFIPYEDVIVGSSLKHDQAISREDASAWFSADWSEMSSRIRSGTPID